MPLRVQDQACISAWENQVDKKIESCLLVPQDAALTFIPKLSFSSRYLKAAIFCSSFQASVNLCSSCQYGSSQMPLHLPAFIILFFGVCDWPHPLPSWLYMAAKLETNWIVTTAKPTPRQMLFLMQLWLQKVQHYQNTLSPAFFQNITSISSASAGKSKNSVKVVFPVLLLVSAGSGYPAADEGTPSLCSGEMHCESRTQTKQSTSLQRTCHSLLNFAEIYCQLESISLCLLIWLKGWFIEAQHHIECLALVRRVMSCRHISFPCPCDGCGCRARLGSAGSGVTQEQFSWGGVLHAGVRISPLLVSPSRRENILFIRRFQIAPQRRKGNIDEREGVERETAVGRTMKWQENKRSKNTRK